MKSHIAPLIYIASLVSLTLQTPVTLNQTLSRSEDVAQSIPIAEPTRAGEVLNHTEQLFVTSTLEVDAEESNDELQQTKNRIEVETLEEKNLVEETLRLIDEGDRRIPFDPNLKDVILVVGNTGAGKTTITKFIAELSDLEAYDAGDRFLIRDKDHKISENSTMVSQTIFPDLIVDTETNDTFYDLPGFADTRNASVEIANAWFMKRVADNSERVKLLFIVNYGSVLSGTTRTGFKTFLQQAAKLVKTPAKFKSAISLVATKVESSRTPDRIINGIAMFLNGIKTDLPEVISDDMERQTAEELIDTILTQDSNGTYTKISFFRQPDEEGPIHQIPSVMSQRPHILNMVFNNTNYTRSVPEDFGISLSPKAILLLTKVVAKINQDLAGDFKVITLQWSANYRNSIEMAPLNTLGEQLTKQNKIEVTISTLSSSNSREDFLQSFDIISMQAASNGSMHDTIVRMGNRLKHLEFFEKSLGQNFSAPISEWAFPFTEFLQELKNATAKQAAALNDQIDQQCLQLGSALTDYFKGYVLNTEVQIQKMELTLSILIHGHQKLMEMVSALEKSTTINGFVGTLKQNIHELIPTLETSNLILLTEDVKMDDEKASLPFSLVSWLSPFYKLTKYVSEQVSMMKIGIQNEKHRIEREEAERRRRMEEEERERQRIAREEQEKREREEAERRRVEHEERMRIEREAQAREALRRQQEYMDLLWRQRRRSSRGGFGQGFNIGFTFRF